MSWEYNSTIVIEIKELRSEALIGNLTPATLIGIKGGTWFPASKVKGLFDHDGKALPHPTDSMTPDPLESIDESYGLSIADLTESEIHFKLYGKTFGPLSLTGLNKAVKNGEVTQKTSIMIDSSGYWLPARDIRGLFQEGTNSSQQQASGGISSKPENKTLSGNAKNPERYGALRTYGAVCGFVCGIFLIIGPQGILVARINHEKIGSKYGDWLGIFS